MARPTKLTPQVRDQIAEAIRLGAYAEQAAAAAGIASSTYYDWIKRGDAGEQPFSEFSEALRACEAQAEVAAVTVLRDAAQAGDWRAAAHYLERRHPERWGRRPQPQVEPVEEATQTQEEFDAEVDRLVAAFQDEANARAEARLLARARKPRLPRSRCSAWRDWAAPYAGAMPPAKGDRGWKRGELTPARWARLSHSQPGSTFGLAVADRGGAARIPRCRLLYRSLNTRGGTRGPALRDPRAWVCPGTWGSSTSASRASGERCRPREAAKTNYGYPEEASPNCRTGPFAAN